MESIKKELNHPELEKVTGGDIIDDVKCLFGGHDNVCVGEKTNPILEYSIRKFRCRTCGKVFYQACDRRGNVKPSSEQIWNEYRCEW